MEIFLISFSVLLPFCCGVLLMSHELDLHGQVQTLMSFVLVMSLCSGVTKYLCKVEEAACCYFYPPAYLTYLMFLSVFMKTSCYPNSLPVDVIALLIGSSSFCNIIVMFVP